MERSGPKRCSDPDCCRDVYITAPKDINITRIDLGSCPSIRDGQSYIVHYNNNQSWQRVSAARCCYGDIYVYYDYLVRTSPEITVSTTTTGIRAVSLTPAGTPASTATPPPTDPPEVSTPSNPSNTPVLVTILLCSALLVILGVGALLYRRYRKLKSAPLEKLTDHYGYSVINESRITGAVGGRISPTTDNYFVLEVAEEPRPHTTSLSSIPTPTQCPSSEYETVQMNTKPEKSSDGVYNTLRECSASPDDVTEQYSSFADFHQEYSHLQR